MYNNQQQFYTQQQIQQMQLQYQQQQAFEAQVKIQKSRQLKEIRRAGFALGTTIIAYLLIQTICVGFLQIFNLMDVYNSSALFQNSANIIIVHFLSMLMPFLVLMAAQRRNFVSPVLPLTKIGGFKKFCWYGIGMGSCVIAEYITSLIILIVKSFTSYKLTQPELKKPNDIFTIIVVIFSTAVIPGICEEIAFRGIGMGTLRKYGKGFAVIAISIVFGLVHGNIIQFIFAFLVGIILAYITIKTDNILFAMCVHATNNGVSVLNDIIKFAGYEKYSTTILGCIQVVFSIMGIISVIYLGAKKELAFPKEQKSPYDNSLGRKLLALLPGMIIPIAFLVYSTIKTIVKQ